MFCLLVSEIAVVAEELPDSEFSLADLEEDLFFEVYNDVGLFFWVSPVFAILLFIMFILQDFVCPAYY